MSDSIHNSRPAALAETVNPARRIALWTLGLVAALALAFSVQVRPAHAGGEWIVPAIAGAIIGGAIVHHHKHHYRKHHSSRHYAYRHHPRPPKVVRYHKPRYVQRYYAPVVVVPVPLFGIHIHRGW